MPEHNLVLCQETDAFILFQAQELIKFATLTSNSQISMLFIFDNIHLDLNRMSNTNRPGIWIFFIGNLGSGNVLQGDIDGDKLLQRSESETCSSSQLPCPPTAKCTDYSNGFCCSCAEGYFGNGRQCLTNS
jgi:hypothetical protein